MRRPAVILGSLAVILAIVASAFVAITHVDAAPAQSRPAFADACGAVSAGFARCFAVQRIGGSPVHSIGIVKNLSCANPASGYTPCDLQTAYNLTTASANNGSGQTVGIVDAYDDPNAESDLAVYRAQFGLPACTTANGCFRKLNQNGVQGNYPHGNTGWAEEISLDLDMASAICPNCHIVLVEAKTNSLANLGASVNTAVNAGATVVSNSYGGSESRTETSYDADYNHNGKAAITASSGDSGFGAQYPATSPYVTAVGGTSLTSISPRVESAWSGAGSGCSAYEAQPSWQSVVGNITSVCSRRAEADVAADADPNTGVDVYDTYHVSGWLVFGGTSVASPIIASVYALAGNASSVTSGSYPYSHTSSLNDITAGSNGSCGTDLCNATAGWDGPTGNGTPNGTGGF
jgi:subtilase family serine protease